MSVATQPPPSPTVSDSEPASPAPTELMPCATSELTSSLGERLYRFSLDEYHRLADAEILLDTRVELIEGLLVKKMSKKPPHIVATELIQNILARILPAGWYVAMQNPIALAASGSEPEPDAKIVRGSPRDYSDRIAGPGDVGLVVEVSDTSLRDDQVVKKAIYARSAVPIYWIVNIPARRIEVYTDPTGPDPAPDYRRRSDHGEADAIPLIIDRVEIARIAVSELLP